jgi:Cu2+-containing amine oxidase
MNHIKVMVAEKEVYVFFDICDQHIVPAALQTIQTHLSDSQVKKIFDDLGLVNITNREATLFSLDGEMISLPLLG